MYDLIIIGSGPSGMTAGIYGARANLNVAIIESSAPGGAMVNTSVIENYPGYQQIDGASLSLAMYQHLMSYPISYIGQKVLKITKEDDYFTVQTTKQSLTGKTVIIATGTKQRTLGVSGEDKYRGHGISWCAICDGPLYKNQDVAVVGGGSSAVKEALYLAKIVHKVYLIHRREQFRADEILLEKASKTTNIEFILNSTVSSFNGDTVLKSLTLENTISKEKTELQVNACFEYIGQLPNSECVSELQITNDNGYIIVDNNYETKVKGLFACGDVILKDVRQIATAINDGAIASLNASKYCR